MYETTAEMKKALRENVLEQLRKLNTQERQRVEESFLSQLQQTPEWQRARVVGVTLSLFPEWDTQHIIACAWHENKQVVVPKVLDKHHMIFVSYTPETSTHVSKMGISEPISNVAVTDIDLLLVPGMVFNEQGYRIGFGGGYYDRYLAQYTGDTISLCASFQLVQTLPIEEHDQCVGQLIIGK